MLPPRDRRPGLAIASVASPSPPLPNPVVVPFTHLQLEVLRRPLDSALLPSISRFRRSDIAEAKGTL